jgi:uncharacterized protein (TIGR03435 family)
MKQYWGSQIVCVIAAVAVSVVVAASQPQNPSARETFEVASIRLRPAVDGGRGAGPLGNTCGAPTTRIDPGRLSISGISVNGLIAMAYSDWADARGGCVGVSAANILSGGPDWIRKDLWDIQATIPAGPVDYKVTTSGPGPRGLPPVTRVEDLGPRIRRMLQSLLADRFNLVLRSQTKDMPVYLLTVGKDGFKSNGNPSWGTMNGGTVKARAVRRITEPDGKTYLSAGIWKTPMPEIALSLFAETERPVLDRTNLTGTFDFHLEYDKTPGGARPPIAKAIEDVGLKMESARAPVEVWVIERVEKPSEN